jgi:predicted porin
MKKLLLATLVSALSITAAHAAPKVYGKINLGVDYVDQDGKDKVTQLNSNASRIGFKGEDELTPTLSAVYQLEYEADVDGDGDVFSQRNAYLGIKSSDLGTVKAGIFDSPIKEAQNKVDIFNDLVSGNIDMKKTLSGEERLSNSIAYTSPELEGVPVEFTLQAAMHEKDAEGNDAKNQIIGSAAYNHEGIYAALAYGVDTSADFNGFIKDAAGNKLSNIPSDILRLVGQVDLDKMGAGIPVTLGALYQNAETSDDSAIDNEKAYLVSAMVKLPMEGWKAGLQYQMSTTAFTTAGKADTEIKQFGGLVGYEFSKKTQAFGYLTTRNQDNGTTDTDYKVFGLGMEHKF